jgi:plasmid stabilization system protein ParE
MSRGIVIEFAESAIGDLEDILAWYVVQEVPGTGKRLLGEIVAQVERLANFPESERIVPEFELPQLREIVNPPFRIVYRIDGVCISIIRVWRGERVLKVPDGDG